MFSHTPALEAHTIRGLLTVIDARKQQIAEMASAERTRVLARYGDYENYYSKLRFMSVTGPGPEFDRAYELYTELFDSARALEKETFYRWLSRANESAVRERYGTFTYRWFVAEDPAEKTQLGMLSYLIVPIPPAISTEYDAAIYGTMAQIRPRSRMPRLFDRLHAEAQRDIRNYLAGIGHIKPNARPRLAIFTNHLHPMAVTPREYLLDHHASGIDCFERIAWSGVLGLRALDIEYERAPPEAHWPSLPGFKYVAQIPGRSTIPAELFIHMHERFCVMRQHAFDPANDLYFQRVCRSARSHGQIPLHEKQPFAMQRMRRLVREWLQTNHTLPVHAGITAERKFGEIFGLGSEKVT
ncbi:MAG: hypothetical protein GC131_07935 [Alphaproteobacteria bacterium]|nr:hypothetical protein [Alphaproteobacteria bacterium]